MGDGELQIKIHWVEWSKILAPISDRGLGLGILKAQNIALLVKWWWRLMNEQNSLWKIIMSSIHNLNDKSAHYIARKSSTGVWSNIYRAVNHLHDINIDHKSLFKLIPGRNVLERFLVQHWGVPAKISSLISLRIYVLFPIRRLYF